MCQPKIGAKITCAQCTDYQPYLAALRRSRKLAGEDRQTVLAGLEGPLRLQEHLAGVVVEALHYKHLHNLLTTC